MGIATLTGENGIITKAQEAKELTEKAEIEEQLRLAQLSATLKNEGGSIQKEDIITELENQGIEFEEEDDGSIVVEGTYMYDFTEENGEIKYDYQGTVSKPKPKIVSIDTSYEDTSIKATVTTLRNQGGKLEFYLKEEEKEFILKHTIEKTMSENNEYTFEGIDITKEYTIKVVATASNGETTEKEVTTINIPKLTEDTIEVSYEVDGKVINGSDWTKGPITVTVSTNSVDATKYTLQTSKDEEIWTDAKMASQIVNKTPIEISSRATTRTTAQITQTSTQIFDSNGTLYVRLKDKSNGQTGKIYKKEITNIDTEGPITFTPTATATSNSITLEGSTTDKGSGIKAYYYSIAEGEEENWEPTEGTMETSYTFNDLTQNQSYKLKMKIVDKLGNETITESITKQTESVPMLTNANFEYTPSTPTNGKVIVKITTNDKNYQIQYKTSLQGREGESLEWIGYPEEGITITRNQAIYARLVDSTEQTTNEYATGNVENIYWLAKDVLKTNSTASKPGEKSPYVKYNENMCRVLYDATSQYGLQIISNESVEQVELGQNDPTVSASDFNYTGSQSLSDKFKQAAASYNKVVDTLNNKANNYKDMEGIAEKARSLGSSPLFEKDTSEMYTVDLYGYMEKYGWTGLFKKTDIKFETDIAQIKSLGLYSSGDIWLASRMIASQKNDTSFYVRLMGVSGNATVTNSLCYVTSNGGAYLSNKDSYGYRPIFLINPEIHIKSGIKDGLTPETAYELGM